MADDWQVGDLAMCVLAGETLCDCGDVHCGKWAPAKGAVTEVVSIYTSGSYYGDECPCRVLKLASGKAGLATRFRKIRPDEHESCEKEFVTLLKKMREPVHG